MRFLVSLDFNWGCDVSQYQSKLTNKFLSDLLGDMKRGFVEPQEMAEVNLAHIWKLCVGEKIAAVTEIKSFNHGLLVIKVSGASLSHLLTTTERPKILARLKKDFSFLKVKNIIFRSG